MEHIAVFVDIAAHARRLIEPMVRHDDTVWTVIGCPPRLSRHVGRWVTHASREQWQRKWLQTLRAELEPCFGRAQAEAVRWMLAREPLQQIARRLHVQHGSALRLLDARLPRSGRPFEPLSGGAALPGSALQWRAPVAVSSSVALMLALAD